MLSINVCSTSDHFFPPSHSPPPTVPIRYLSSVTFSLSMAAFSSPVNSSFSQRSQLRASSTVSPLLRLLLLASIAALHLLRLLSLSVPLLPPLILPHSVFNRLGSLSQFGRPRLIASLRPSLPPNSSLHFFFCTVPSVFAKHREAENHHSVNLQLLPQSAATFKRAERCLRKHKTVERHFSKSALGLRKEREWNEWPEAR